MKYTLDVYLHDKKAGQLTQNDNAALSFEYAADYLSNSAHPAISVSMPLQEEPYADHIARPYFSGLLPDERARKLLASTLGVSEGNAFGLLEVIGGECAGALSLLAEGDTISNTNDHSPEPLTDKRLAEILEHLRVKPLLGGEKGVRLSLAGAQDKLAVCVVDGKVALAKHGQPTTHILKPYIEGLEGTVENEIFCMRLAGRVGLPAPKVSRGSAGKIDYYLVERYDRTIDSNGTITRLHQEDFCQALSVPPELKYENEGGPGVAAAQELIDKQSRKPAADRLAFQRMLIFNYLVGNADAHAKNYSLLYNEHAPDLAPPYDIICTAAYPNLAKNFAMKIGERDIPDTIHLNHWMSLVPNTRAAQRMLTKELQQLSQRSITNSKDLLSELEDDIYHPILRKVQKIIKTRAEHIQHFVEAGNLL